MEGIVLFRQELDVQGLFSYLFRGTAKPRLSSAAMLEGCFPQFYGSGLGMGIHRVVFVKAHQNLICGVLQSAGGLMQLASRLGGKLAQFVAVPDMGQSPKYQIRTHQFILLIVDRVHGSQNPAGQKAIGREDSLFFSIVYRRLNLAHRFIFLKPGIDMLTG
jgi:hypothetical protein